MLPGNDIEMICVFLDTSKAGILTVQVRTWLNPCSTLNITARKVWFMWHIRIFLMKWITTNIGFSQVVC